MWPLFVSVAVGQTSPLFDVDCTPEGPFADVGPVDVRCVVQVSTDEYGEPVGTFTEAQWFMGDGTVLEGEFVEHTYEEVGAYNLTVKLPDLVLDGETELAAERDRRTTYTGFFSVCGVPEPRFDIVDKGGLIFDLVNMINLDEPRCLRTLMWTVRRENGNRDLFTFDTWEPRFELPEEGTYVVSLEASGVGGTTIASGVLDARYGLTSDHLGFAAGGCSSAPLGAPAGLLLLVAAAARRTRR